MALAIEPGHTFAPNELVTSAKLASLVADAGISGIGRSHFEASFFGITASSAEPAGLAEGEIWWDSDNSRHMTNNGSTVVPLPTRQESLIEYRSGAATVIPGDVVIVNAAVDDTVISTTSSFSPLFAGVVQATVGNAQTARLARQGKFSVNFTGSGSRGDYAYTSGTAGKARAQATATLGSFGMLTTDVAGGVANVLVGVLANPI